MPDPLRFSAALEAARGGGALVEVPPSVAAALGGLKQMRVFGTINGVPYHSSTMPLGGRRLYLGVHKATREAAKVAIGETLEVEVTRDSSPRELALPPELEDAFRAEPHLGERFVSLSFSRRRDIATPIADAKRPETRARRLEDALRRLRESPPTGAGKTGTRTSDAPDRPGGRG